MLSDKMLHPPKKYVRISRFSIALFVVDVQKYPLISLVHTATASTRQVAYTDLTHPHIVLLP